MITFMVAIGLLALLAVLVWRTTVEVKRWLALRHTEATEPRHRALSRRDRRKAARQATERFSERVPPIAQGEIAVPNSAWYSTPPTTEPPRRPEQIKVDWEPES